MSEITLETAGRLAVLDVTDAVQGEVAGSKDGLALVSIKHTTAAIVICADEPGLRDDVLRVVGDLLAAQRPFRHLQEGRANGEAHLLSALLGTRVCVRVVDGRLDLGVWQRLLLIELDGPQQRTVHVHVNGGAGSDTG